ncbi:MAG: ABC transporter substrate-binding protein [Methanosphaera sp.]|uniref:ABC transporter substrate-binding protein n=1 Tax=Methanosphaera sp. TaxID=2666342 RepID=UPI002E7856DD|nr:ABC transporter substrate-binding protein [Methanosphaera sp.]MEE1116764.1 ABC transporter substrate-binding protein [Methanosphaera sp.]MEE3324606.1 ABC transporter substrate-binding protein [Methanosphaera sp.]MEE3417940.1 ABC transporter substrate-binding protein [Methanosphaera sp.]
MSNQKIIGIIIAVVVLLLVAFFAFNSLTNNSETVHIGYLPSDHDAALFVADASGMYKDAGINVELHEYNNGGDLMSAMASGDLDVGYVGIAPVVSSISKGVPAKIVAGAQNEGSGLLSHDSSITSVADLKGKTIATPGEASIQSVLLKYDLKKNGMSTSDVKSPGMKVASMNDALKTGSIDAMLTYEPFVSISEKSNNQHIVERSGDIIPNHPCCVVVMSDKFLADHHDQAQKIVEIHKEATQKIIDNPEGIIQYLPSNIVSNETVEKESLSHIKWVTEMDDAYKNNVNNFLNIEKDLGIINQTLDDSKLYADI